MVEQVLVAVRDPGDRVLLERSWPGPRRGMGILARFLAWLAGSRPEVRVHVRPGNPTLGEDVELEWELDGTLRGVRTLDVSLEGLEEAWAGDAEPAERSTFLRVPVATLDGAKAIRRSGGGVATLPSDSVPSFSAPHNRILWRVRVQGRMRFGQDLDESFEIRVRPLPVGSPR